MSPEAWAAIAEWVTATSVLAAAGSWTWHHWKTVGTLVTRRFRKQMKSVLHSEVTAGEAWQAVTETPEVSMEAGIAWARAQTQTGRAPYTPTQGFPAPDQPLDYLLAKTGEVVWNAARSAQSELEPELPPLRNYMTALAAKAGVNQARDFALGVLTERVRQEEDGWPDQPGDPRGKRGPHGTGNSHLCLLERKHQVEDAIYAIGEQVLPG